MRILFAGTPAIAVPTLHELVRGPHQVVGVLTNPDRPAGRGRSLVPTPVKQAALDHGLPVYQPTTLRSDARREIGAVKPDLLVCVAYGRIFGPKFLGLFPFGGINLHPSLLPRFRGPAPIPASILAGDARTGVSIQRLALEMDAGDILAQRSHPLDGSETTASLSEMLAREGAKLLSEVVDAIAGGTAVATAQQHAEATYSTMITKRHGRIDWSLPAAMIDRAVRAYTPWPQAWTTLDDKRLTVLAARVAETGGADPRSLQPGQVAPARKQILVATGDGVLSIDRLQLAGKKPLDAAAFLNGVQLAGRTLV